MIYNQHKFILGQNQHIGNANELERKSTFNGFKLHFNSEGVIVITKFMESSSRKFPIFDTKDIGIILYIRRKNCFGSKYCWNSINDVENSNKT